jgi:hypothetical protein
MSRASASVVFAALALPVALAGCPQFASDWTIAGSSSDGGGGDRVEHDASGYGEAGSETGGSDAALADTALTAVDSASQDSAAVTDTGATETGGADSSDSAGCGSIGSPCCVGNLCPTSGTCVADSCITCRPPGGNCTTGAQCCSHDCDQLQYTCT